MLSTPLRLRITTAPHVSSAADGSSRSLAAKAAQQRERIRLVTGKTVDELIARGYSQKERDQMAKSGEALKSGAYPIRNAKDLKSALVLFQSGHGNDPKSQIKAHIIARAKALGLTSLLPDDWNVGSRSFDFQSAWSGIGQMFAGRRR